MGDAEDTQNSQDETSVSHNGIIITPNIFEVAKIKREIANATVLKDMLDVLKDIRTSIEEEKPDLFRQYGFPITDESRSIDSGSIPTMPWIAFTLCNDGPNPIYVFVNDKLNIREQPSINSQSSNVSPVRKGESIKFSMRKPEIKRVYMQCATGETASVRIYSESKIPVVE
jgi:hypothetical protein